MKVLSVELQRLFISLICCLTPPIISEIISAWGITWISCKTNLKVQIMWVWKHKPDSGKDGRLPNQWAVCLFEQRLEAAFEDRSEVCWSNHIHWSIWDAAGAPSCWQPPPTLKRRVQTDSANQSAWAGTLMLWNHFVNFSAVSTPARSNVFTMWW